MTDELKFDATGLGKWSEECTFGATRARIAEYAAATNDPIEAHSTGTMASPVFAIVPVFQSMMIPLFSVVPPALASRGVHGASDFRFHRPIRPEDNLVSRGKMVGYEGMPNGTRGHLVLECRTEDGELINEQHVTVFVRGFDAGETIGELAPDHSFPDELRDQKPLVEVSQHVDSDQTFRYSPAAGDPMPIHLDDTIAKQAGLPGIIVHGLCTMAFTSWAVLTEVAESDGTKLKRLAARFAKPVLPGQDLTTRIWKGGSSGGTTTYHYETTVDGTVVLRDGLAEIAD